jgi:hypothetical protein
VEIGVSLTEGRIGCCLLDICIQYRCGLVFAWEIVEVVGVCARPFVNTLNSLSRFLFYVVEET